MNPTKIAVSGFSSDSGKTTLMAELLSAFPGWEAIKMTRGHYRSCGKDPEACCVSHLLGDEPVVRSGHAETYTAGKDTGRYWDAGASNVHWVIVTDSQVERGIRIALDRVEAPGVLIEGNSFLSFVDVDFAIMVARAEGGKIKPSAKRVLRKSEALYLFAGEHDTIPDRELLISRYMETSGNEAFDSIPLYSHETLPALLSQVRAAHSGAR